MNHVYSEMAEIHRICLGDEQGMIRGSIVSLFLVLTCLVLSAQSKVS